MDARKLRRVVFVAMPVSIVGLWLLLYAFVVTVAVVSGGPEEWGLD